MRLAEGYLRKPMREDRAPQRAQVWQPSGEDKKQPEPPTNQFVLPHHMTGYYLAHDSPHSQILRTAYPRSLTAIMFRTALCSVKPRPFSATRCKLLLPFFLRPSFLSVSFRAFTSSRCIRSEAPLIGSLANFTEEEQMLKDAGTTRLCPRRITQ